MEVITCSYVTSRTSHGHPRTSVTWDYRSVAVTIEGTSQEVPGTSQDMSEYVRNTLTSDGSPRYLWRKCVMLDHTPTVDSHTPHANWRIDIEWWSAEAYATMAFCVKVFANTKLSGLPPWARNCLVEQRDWAVLILASTTPEHLWVHRHFVYWAFRRQIDCIVANHLIHTGTSSYRYIT